MLYKMQSMTDASIVYDVDTTNKTCTCPAFKKLKGAPCKHLGVFGIYNKRFSKLSNRPTFSQALSAMVKSIRIRDTQEAIKWLYYLYFKCEDKGTNFRVSRRVLIGSAEDGFSIPVMESAERAFHAALAEKDKRKIVLSLSAAIVRICAYKNWSQTEFGRDYIQEFLWAERVQPTLRLKDSDYQEALSVIENPNECDSDLLYFDWLTRCEKLPSQSELAEHIEVAAKARGNAASLRLVELVKRNYKFLSQDNNFTSQAFYHLLDLPKPEDTFAEPIPLKVGDVAPLVDAAHDFWIGDAQPPIAAWFCDGVHCAGYDQRLAGMFVDMVALSNATLHYGEGLNVNSVWKDEFFSTEGLCVQEVSE